MKSILLVVKLWLFLAVILPVLVLTACVTGLCHFQDRICIEESR